MIHSNLLSKIPQQFPNSNKNLQGSKLFATNSGKKMNKSEALKILHENLPQIFFSYKKFDKVKDCVNNFTKIVTGDKINNLMLNDLFEYIHPGLSEDTKQKIVNAISTINIDKHEISAYCYAIVFVLTEDRSATTSTNNKLNLTKFKEWTNHNKLKDSCKYLKNYKMPLFLTLCENEVKNAEDCDALLSIVLDLNKLLTDSEQQIFVEKFSEKFKNLDKKLKIKEEKLKIEEKLEKAFSPLLKSEEKYRSGKNNSDHNLSIVYKKLQPILDTANTIDFDSKTFTVNWHYCINYINSKEFNHNDEMDELWIDEYKNFINSYKYTQQFPDIELKNKLLTIFTDMITFYQLHYIAHGELEIKKYIKNWVSSLFYCNDKGYIVQKHDLIYAINQAEILLIKAKIAVSENSLIKEYLKAINTLELIFKIKVPVFPGEKQDTNDQYYIELKQLIMKSYNNCDQSELVANIDKKNNFIRVMVKEMLMKTIDDSIIDLLVAAIADVITDQDLEELYTRLSSFLCLTRRALVLYNLALVR